MGSYVSDKALLENRNKALYLTSAFGYHGNEFSFLQVVNPGDRHDADGRPFTSLQKENLQYKFRKEDSGEGTSMGAACYYLQ